VDAQPDFPKDVESTFLYPCFFRGILVVSYYFKSELYFYLRDQKMQHFPAEFWALVQYSLKILLSKSKGE
jgi:hypothetical protein